MRFPAILLAAALMAGCGSPTPTFYTLSAEGKLPSGGGTSIGVGPVTLAEYVNRRNLVIQTGPNRIEVAESHLWAGDLDNSVARVLATNLGRRLATGNVRTYPWQRDSEIDHQVAVDIREFIAGDDGHARIEATWRVYSLPGSRLVRTRTFIGKEPVTAEDYESVVAAQSRLLGKLSADIAAGIRGR
jgi:uncharacterized lipoprotein YmbA